MFGKSLHQQEYKVLGKGLDAGFRKHQISNLFSSEGALRTANISPLTAIERFSGIRNGNIRADCYDDCQDIPDPSTLDLTQKNLLLLDDCFLDKQNKAEPYYTEVDTTTGIQYTLHKTISDYNSRQFKTLLSCSHKT